MLVTIIIVSGVIVMILGLACLGTKLAIELEGSDGPTVLTASQESDRKRIKVLLETAKNADALETKCFLIYDSDMARFHHRAAARCRNEARKIAKKARIKLVDGENHEQEIKKR